MTLIDLGERFGEQEAPATPIRRRVAPRERRWIGICLVVALILVIAPRPPVSEALRVVATYPGVLAAVPVIIGDVAYTAQRSRPGQDAIRLSAYTVATGGILWSNELPGIDRVTGVRMVGGVLVMTSDAVAVVIDPATGTEIRRYPDEMWFAAGVGIAIDTFLDDSVPAGRSRFFAVTRGLDLRTGQELWQRDLPMSSGARLVVPDDARGFVSVIDSADATAHTVDARTGALVASASLSREAGHVYYAAAAAGVIALVVEEDEPVLLAVDPATLAVRWRRPEPVNSRICGAVICTGDVGGDAIDPATGRVLFNRSVSWPYLLDVPGGLAALSLAPPGGLNQRPVAVAFLDAGGYSGEPIHDWVYIGRDGSGAALLLGVRRDAPRSWLARLDAAGQVHVTGAIPAVRNCVGAQAGFVCVARSGLTTIIARS
jgi:hypothetical protein